MKFDGRQLSEEAQVSLLLCAPLVAAKQPEPRPLSPGEFNDVEQRITRAGFRLSQFLDGKDAKAMIEEARAEVETERLEALLGRGFLVSQCVERWVSAGIWILGRTDEGYPRRLSERMKHNAPVVLYGCGELSLLDRGGVAIVGSRDVDEDGAEFTRRLAASCAKARMTVVSGGARGVDQEAMLAAVEAGGSVVGVMADSLGRAIAAGKARDPIREGQLTLISPFDPEAGFNTGNAMNRNKQIYALSDYGVVVASGFNEGGTWSGALEQLERYKFVPVFVRGGDNVPEGNRQLLKRGALEFPEKQWPDSLKTELERLAASRRGVMETGDLFASPKK